MPISIKKDVKPWYGFGSRFSLRKTAIYTPLGGETIYFGGKGGSYLNAVRPGIAEKNWKEFHSDANFSAFDFERDVARSISLKFDLDPGLIPTFDELWTFARNAREYEKAMTDVGAFHKDLQDAYRLAARLAAGENPTETTFSRVEETSEEKLVIFSDFHMTALRTVPDYFADFNYRLYLEVLDYYAANDFCLVENGDVEDCLMYVPDLDEAKARSKAAVKSAGIGELAYPIRLNDPAWDEFMELRYAKRRDSQDRIIGEFDDYYDAIRNKFIDNNRNGKLRYIRLTGNHDTYLNQKRERELRERIETELGVSVVDVLRIRRDGQIRYVVTHGHQFDEACMQHGTIPFAKSLGEIYTECVGWCNQGGDRVWREDDTKRWCIGGKYENALAWAHPGTYSGDSKGALLLGNIENIKLDSKNFIEELLKRQVAWEYFENTDGINDHLAGFNDKADAFNAFALEVWTGDEMYKLRHLDEVSLVEGYEAEFNALETGQPIPKLIVGHSHEPRQNSVHSKGGTVHAVNYYLNSGSAGRYQNLIWCVEIEGLEDRIVSWSKIDGQLTKITWDSNHGVLEHESKVVVSGTE
jgi:hypothetical protein